MAPVMRPIRLLRMPRSSMPGAPMLCRARQRPSTSSFCSPLALRWAMQSSSHWRALDAASWAARPTAGSLVRSVKRYWKMVLPQSANSRSEGGTVPKYPAIQRAGTTRLKWLTSSSLPPDCDTICSAVLATNPAMAARSWRRITLVVGRVLHTEEEILAAGDHAHLRTVGHLENVVARQHLLDIFEPRDQGDILDDEDGLHAAQHGEQGLGILGGMRFQTIQECHDIALRVGQGVFHGCLPGGLRLVQSAFQILE